MAETLSGDISELSLLQILKMLNSGKMNGCLAVTNSVTDGEIFVKDGQIIHCTAGSATGEIALLNMLGWLDGRFRFENSAETLQTSIHKKTELLLREGEKKIKDWQQIKSIVRSMDMVFELVPGSDPSGVNLKPLEWEIISQINGARTVTDIVDLIDKDEFDVAQTIYNLAITGKIQERSSHRAHTQRVSDNFFELMEQELVNAIGPMASIIIDESVEQMGGSRSDFPTSKIAALVERVSNEIKQEEKKLKFSQIMIRSLNKY